MTSTSRLLAAFLAGLLLAAMSSTARAACDITGVLSAAPSIMSVGTYTATAIPPPTTVAVTLTVTKTGNGSCQAGIALYRPTAPAQMTRLPPSGVALPYAVTFQGSTVLYFAGGAPTIIRVPNFHGGNGAGTATFTIAFQITPQPPISAPPSGTYADQLTLRVYNRNGGKNYALVGQVPLTVAAEAIQSCYLTAPSALSLNFSSDIITGMPAGGIQSASFSVNCTGPARLQLSGSALVRPQGVQPSGVFDSLINYRTVASFGGASTTLITNGVAPVTVTSPGQSNLVGSNLPVNLNINLLPNRPLLGGSTYSGVLRVIIDPAL
jgi:hypothetical protein